MEENNVEHAGDATTSAEVRHEDPKDQGSTDLPHKATLDYYFRPKKQNSLDGFVNIQKKDKKKRKHAEQDTEKESKSEGAEAKKDEESTDPATAALDDKKVSPLRQKKIQHFLDDQKKEDKEATKETVESPSKRQKGE